MEFCDDGDLFQKITQHQQNKTKFEEEQVWRLVFDVVNGLKALHDLKILHRDMKSANIFLNKDGQAKLGDMNVSKVAKKGLLYTQTGTPYYASPEVWDDKPYDSKSDIWSLGCVIYEMCTLKPPFRANDMEGLYKKVVKGQYGRIPKTYSFELHHLIDMLLQVDPHRRPNCGTLFLDLDEIIKMPILQKRQSEQSDMLDEVINGLMNTIRIPKKIHNLQDRLPKPNYSPLKMRPRENSASAMSFDNANKITHATGQNSSEDIRSLPKIKRKLIDIVDRSAIFDQRRLDLNIDKRRKRGDSIEKILQARNDRIRQIYGQARKKRNQREHSDSKEREHSQLRINLPSLGKNYLN